LDPPTHSSCEPGAAGVLAGTAKTLVESEASWAVRGATARIKSPPVSRRIRMVISLAMLCPAIAGKQKEARRAPEGASAPPTDEADRLRPSRMLRTVPELCGHLLSTE